MEKEITQEPYLEHFYLDCACSDFSHTIRFSLHRADGPGDFPELYTEIGIQAQPCFWRRLWTAVRYVVRGDFCSYGNYSTTLDLRGARELRRFLDAFIAQWERSSHGDH